MAIYSLIFSLLVLFCISSLLFKSFINPCSIFSFVWLSVSIGAAFFETTIEDKYKLSYTTINIIFLSVFFFFLGSILNLNSELHGIKKVEKKINNNEKSYYFNLFLVFLSLIFLPIVIYRASLMIYDSTYFNIFNAIRSNLTDETSEGLNYGIGAYGVTIANISFLLALNDFLKTGNFKKILVFSFIICLTFDILSTSRTALFFTLIPSLFLIYVYKGLKIGSILLALIIMSFIFGIYNVFKNFTDFDSDGDLFSFAVFLDSFQIYFLGGVYAINNKINSANFIGVGDGTMIFRTYFAIKNTLGFDVKTNGLIFGYELTPIKTNVYTLFFPYLYDLGIWFVFLFTFIIGFIHTFFYKNSQKSDSCIIAYSLLMYPLFMSFFQDQYFFLLSVWIQYVLLLLFRKTYFKLKLLI